MIVLPTYTHMTHIHTQNMPCCHIHMSAIRRRDRQCDYIVKHLMSVCAERIYTHRERRVFNDTCCNYTTVNVNNGWLYKYTHTHTHTHLPTYENICITWRFVWHQHSTFWVNWNSFSFLDSSFRSLRQRWW